jgi:hypothetical protein
MGKRMISKIAPDKRENGIEWIVLELDFEKSGGVFLFLHSDMSQPCMYDEWYEDLEKAQGAAFRKWGVMKGDWNIQNPED